MVAWFVEEIAHDRTERTGDDEGGPKKQGLREFRPVVASRSPLGTPLFSGADQAATVEVTNAFRR